MKRQIDTLINRSVRAPNSSAEAAATAVLEVTGIGEGKCVFLSSGSEAVEFGVQAVRRLLDRPLLLRFSSSYLAAYGSASRSAPEEWRLLDWRNYDPEEPEACLRALPFDRIGGFVLEPGGGSPEFVNFPPASLVAAIAER